MSDTTENIKHLSILGLSQVEASIYLYLAEGQPQTALHLSQALGIPRTTIYDSVSSLQNRGLLERVIVHKSTLYKARELESFKSAILAQEEKAKSMQLALQELSTRLKSKEGNVKNTEVRYYQGAEGLRQMIWNCLKAKDEIVGYSVFGRVEIAGFNFYQRFVDEFKSRGLADRVIANPTQRTLSLIGHDVRPGKHQLKGQNIRTLTDRELYIAGDTMIYNNVYAVSYWQGSEVVGVEIENSDLVNHERSIFELLWKIAQPLNK